MCTGSNDGMLLWLVEEYLHKLSRILILHLHCSSAPAVVRIHVHMSVMDVRSNAMITWVTVCSSRIEIVTGL
jgi:hypothetical protein